MMRAGRMILAVFLFLPVPSVCVRKLIKLVVYFFCFLCFLDERLAPTSYVREHVSHSTVHSTQHPRGDEMKGRVLASFCLCSRS